MQGKFAALEKAAAVKAGDAFEQQVGALAANLSSSATQLQTTAHAMAETASVTLAQASSVADAAEKMSAGIQSTAASAEKLLAMVHEIGQSMAQSARISGAAVKDAEHTSRIVRTLAEGAQRIGQVLELITGIARQTNLLALNAVTEAASNTGDAADQVLGASGALSRQAGSLTASVRQFVERVRAA